MVLASCTTHCVGLSKELTHSSTHILINLYLCHARVYQSYSNIEEVASATMTTPQIFQGDHAYMLISCDCVNLQHHPQSLFGPIGNIDDGLEHIWHQYHRGSMALLRSSILNEMKRLTQSSWRTRTWAFLISASKGTVVSLSCVPHKHVRFLS